MATRVGINGFGRIGRLTFKTISQYHLDELEVVAVNDLTDTKTNAHLLKWDSTYGKFPCQVEATNKAILVDRKEVKVFAEQPFSLAKYRANYVGFIDHPVCSEADVNKILCSIQ